MDFHEMSRRAARYERHSAHMPGLMDMIADAMISARNGAA